MGGQDEVPLLGPSAAPPPPVGTWSQVEGCLSPPGAGLVAGSPDGVGRDEVQPPSCLFLHRTPTCLTVLTSRPPTGPPSGALSTI